MNHRHLLVRAVGLSNPPRTPEVVTDWLARLVEAVNMKIMMGPFAERLDEPGNEGVTGAVGIERSIGLVVIKTSHASLHCWDALEQPFLDLDLYSCDDFYVRTVLDLLREFGPSTLEWMLVDRNGRPEVLEIGSYTL